MSINKRGEINGKYGHDYTNIKNEVKIQKLEATIDHPRQKWIESPNPFDVS